MLAGLEPGDDPEVKVPELNVSYKPQKIVPKSEVLEHTLTHTHTHTRARARMHASTTVDISLYALSVDH
jgi:hypothetical protein